MIAPDTTAAVRGIRKTRGRRRTQGQAYLFLSPAMILFAVFTFIPIGWSILLSLQNYNAFANHGTFVGLHNYTAAISSSTFWSSLSLTAYFVFGSVPITIALALGLAVLLNRKGIKGTHIFQAVLFLPYILSSVGATLVWKWMFDTNFGVINGVLGWFGIPPIAWLTTTSGAMPAIIIMSIWGGVGFAMVIFQAGLAGIPQDVLEAAEIDGATRRQSFWRVVFPLLAPTTLFVVIISIINAAQVFTAVQVMTNGGPLNATNVIVFYIYQEAFQFYNMGFGSALAIVLFIITLILTAIMMMLSRRYVYYEGEVSDGRSS